MLTITYKWLLLFLIVSLSASCATSRKFAEQGSLQEESGLYEEAAESFYQALRRDRDNIDAQIGLKKNGQITLDKKLEDFRLMYTAKKYQSSYDVFLAADTYSRRVGSVGVFLTIPVIDREAFAENKNILAAKIYKEADIYYHAKNWELAIIAFEKVANIIDNYKDVSTRLAEVRDKRNNELADMAIKKARAFERNSKFKEAYYAYEEALRYRPDDTFALERQELALREATVTVGMFPVFDHAAKPSLTEGVVDLLYQNSFSRIQESESTFLELLDRHEIQRLFNEHRLGGLWRIRDGVEAAELGAQAGLDIAVYIRLAEARHKWGKVARTQYKAIESKEVTDNSTGRKSRQQKEVFYTVYEGNTLLTMQIEYEVRDTRTNQILRSQALPVTVNDHIKYARYDGDYQYLVDVNMKLFEARKEFRHIRELKLAVVGDLTTLVSDQISDILKSR